MQSHASSAVSFVQQKKLSRTKRILLGGGSGGGCSDAAIQSINIYIVDVSFYNALLFFSSNYPLYAYFIGRFFYTIMIGTSAVEYFFIRVCILFLHNIAPVSILYSIHLLAVQYFHLPIYPERVPNPIHVWLIAETVFFATVFIPLKYARRHSPIYHRSLSAECREKLFRSCNANVPNLEKYLCRWLMVSEAECIKRDNVKDFIRWAFFRPGYRHEQDQQNEAEIETYTAEIEKLIGRKLSPGRMDVKGLGQLLNEAGGLHRSLLWYNVSDLSLRSV